MPPITFDPILAAAVWKLTGTIRGAIPAGWINIDGKWRCWGLVGLATVVALYLQSQLGQGLPADALGWLHFALEGAVTAVGAVLIDGAAGYAGLKDTVRHIDTLGGLTNPLPTATEGAAVAAVVQRLPAGAQRTAQEIVEDFKRLVQDVREVQAAARDILASVPAPAGGGTSPAPSAVPLTTPPVMAPIAPDPAAAAPSAPLEPPDQGRGTSQPPPPGAAPGPVGFEPPAAPPRRVD